MANVKYVKQIISQEGSTLYCIIRRNDDSYYMDYTTGEFTSVPVNMYAPLAENILMKGFYELQESRSVWRDGSYDVIIYVQVGASPDPVPDAVVGGGQMDIVNDTESTTQTTTMARVASEATYGSSLSSIVQSIQMIIQDSSINDTYIIGKINDAIQKIAGGVRMPNGEISPPLPDLYKFYTVSTTALSYVALPSDYQRNIFSICDESTYPIPPPRGGDYYSFSRFVKQITKSNMSEVGSVYRVCVRGSKLYYQGIPATPYVLGLHYYRKPAILVLDGDIPEGIPAHLQEDVIKHCVCMDIYGENIEDGQDNTAIGTKYHSQKFIEDMTDLIDFVGRDAEPQYYGEGGFEDRGIVDG